MHLSEINIHQVHIGDGTTHDGYVEVYLGPDVQLNILGSKALENHLIAKVKPASGVVAFGNIVKITVDPHDNGDKLTADELNKFAKSCIASIVTWASDLDPVDDARFTESDAARIEAAMAVHSKSASFNWADRS